MALICEPEGISLFDSFIPPWYVCHHECTFTSSPVRFCILYWYKVQVHGFALCTFAAVCLSGSFLCSVTFVRLSDHLLSSSDRQLGFTRNQWHARHDIWDVRAVVSGLRAAVRCFPASLTSHDSVHSSTFLFSSVIKSNAASSLNAFSSIDFIMPTEPYRPLHTLSTASHISYNGSYPPSLWSPWQPKGLGWRVVCCGKIVLGNVFVNNFHFPKCLNAVL